MAISLFAFFLNNTHIFWVLYPWRLFRAGHFTEALIYVEAFRTSMSLNLILSLSHISALDRGMDVLRPVPAERDLPSFPLQDFAEAQSVDFTSAPVALRLDVGKKESELSPVYLDTCDKPSNSEDSIPACLSNPKLLKVNPKKNKCAIKVRTSDKTCPKH